MKKFRWIAALACALAIEIPAAFAQVGESPPFELKASAAYSADFDQYLMVYTSNEIDNGPTVYGRVLSTESAIPVGKDFRMSTEVGGMSKPVLAYNPHTQQFLAVWARKLYPENRSEIIGLNVGRDGKIIGQEFAMTFSSIFDERPAIAYCKGRDRFLVTWTRTTQYDFESGDADVYGQFIAGNGTSLQGSNFPISSAPRNQFKSELACDESNDRFMVVWEDQRNDSTQDDIYAQLISSDGTMMGDNFMVSGTPDLERRPTIAASKNGTYLVLWEADQANTAALFSRTMDSNGKLLGQPVEVGTNIGGEPNRPSVAYLEKQSVFLAAWTNSNQDGTPGGIFAQFFEKNGQLRQTAFPLTTSRANQCRPDVAAAKNSFLSVWTDYRLTALPQQKDHIYEYFGRVIGNDSALSSRWRNPESE